MKDSKKITSLSKKLKQKVKSLVGEVESPSQRAVNPKSKNTTLNKVVEQEEKIVAKVKPTPTKDIDEESLERFDSEGGHVPDENNP